MDHDDSSIPVVPPADPEEWTDEQWIAWLNATDEDQVIDDLAEVETGPTTLMGKVARSGGGQVVGQAMLGMAQAIWGTTKDEIVQIADGGGEPEPDEPFTVHLDPDHPERSTVVFRAEPPDPA